MENAPLLPHKAILLVEDDPQDVEILGLAFAQVGSSYQIVSVTNGREAIHYLSGLGQYADRKRFPMPALMLLDLSLPVTNGFEVLTWMQGEPPDKMPPAVVLSYSRDEHDRRLAQKFGAKGYYVKSPSLDETVALVKSLLLLNWLPPITDTGGTRNPNPP